MPRRRLPPLGALPAFEATVRLASMSRAAEELGRTHGAVSRQVRALEEALRLTLLDRGAPGLRPTRAGAELYSAVSTAFATLETALERLAPRDGMQGVRLACGSTFAARWLVPRLPRFYALHPGISVSLVMVRRSFQDGEDYDVATSWDRLTYAAPKGRHVHVIGEVRLAAIAAPGHAARCADGVLEAECRLVAETWPSAWEAFAAHAGLALAIRREMRFPHLHHCIEAALSGLGVALVEERLVAEHLESGRLVVLGEVLRFPEGFLAIENRQHGPNAAVRKLIGWLRTELG
ncbi:LysR substrate-binding domain-containing protein [Siccirubricoccus sp. KC 17139]|uniref:LysR substrate-binding domain-containing protein n=1 Tax=Siccirubricoccus soli TaxID=2899147 RepID=A0ABT1D7J2_9PROT|nr:LysR substrate-binding domain-containing protein [Siccirubricoccus soli]MCP2684006.1 LysR substrate-binding domain-containing protein [Siccirubricoccus soli]